MGGTEEDRRYSIERITAMLPGIKKIEPGDLAAKDQPSLAVFGGITQRGGARE